MQRVPATEASGRIHTSTATVAVLPEAEEVDVQIDDKDLRIDTFCSSGPGGQSVNTTYSAVRITHIPTGIVVSQQDEKSQIKNRAKAMKVLRSRLYEIEMRKQQEAIAKDRRSQVGTGERSEKIRTYNFKENRITDHRINFTMHQLTDALDGDLDELIDAVATHYQSEKLKEHRRPAQRRRVGMPGTLDERLAQARRTLVAAGIAPDDAAIDVEVLARHVLGWTRASLLAHGHDPVPTGFEERFAAALARRAAREPVAYITGVREFWTRDFEVDRSVLIPRPETELIVEAVIERDHDRPRILDVGTGSGCLAVTLAAELPKAQVIATDVSAEAIALARRNAARHGVSARVLFVLTNLLDGLPNSFDIIVSNPPYVARASELPPDVIQATNRTPPCTVETTGLRRSVS